ncbi:MAG: hypothetical protein ABSG86_32045 [Thermoguttaceae bacterium]
MLSVPVKVQPPPQGGLDWRRGEIAFVLEASPAASGGPQGLGKE